MELVMLLKKKTMMMMRMRMRMMARAVRQGRQAAMGLHHDLQRGVGRLA
jgi:hypothetical protein